MQLRRMLGIQPGLTAIIGGGGKTTLLYALARELSQTARVIVCTTTHILPPEHLPCLTDGTETEIHTITLAQAENDKGRLEEIIKKFHYETGIIPIMRKERRDEYE